MKKITFIMLFFLNISSHADYIRFWVGFKKQNITQDKFIKGLNEKFFKETVEQSYMNGKYGVNVYLPTLLLDEANTSKPDEIALVIYRDEKTYQEIRRTERGTKYAELHWQYFDQSKSKSYIPEAYPAILKRESAYEIIPFKEWKSFSVMARFSPKQFTPAQVADIIDNTKSSQGIKGYVVLYFENSLIEYIAFDKKKVSIIKRPDYDTETIYLKNAKIDDIFDLQTGQGMNLQYEEK